MRESYPQYTLLVPAEILISAGLLFIGLSLPLMYAKQMFWDNTYSVWTGVVALWHQNEILLATVLFFFSIVFPLVKLSGLAVIWFGRLPEEHRALLLHWLGLLG